MCSVSCPLSLFFPKPICFLFRFPLALPLPCPDHDRRDEKMAPGLSVCSSCQSNVIVLLQKLVFLLAVRSLASRSSLPPCPLTCSPALSLALSPCPVWAVAPPCRPVPREWGESAGRGNSEAKTRQNEDEDKPSWAKQSHAEQRVSKDKTRRSKATRSRRQ